MKYIRIVSALIILLFHYFDMKGQSADTSPVRVRKAPRLIDVYKFGQADKPEGKRNVAGIGEIIVVKVENLDSLLERSTCKDASGSTIPNCTKAQIKLFLDGREIDNIAPISGAPKIDSTGTGELQFKLERNSDNDNAWATLLGSPAIGPQFFNRRTEVSIGLAGSNAIPSDIYFEMVRIKKVWFWFCFFGLLVYMIVVIILSIKSDLLRDRPIDISSLNVTTAVSKLQYSLGRFQMAFWFSLVLASFLFIWLITDAYDIITPSVLGLIGISVGTSLSSAVIDNSKREEMLKITKDSQQKQAQLTTDVASLNAQISAVPAPANKLDLEKERNEKQAEIQQLDATVKSNIEALKPKSSKGFLKDVLTDSNGMSFHRLQMFVWTFVLGIIFIYSVWYRLSMPEFSATLLALQGLTAGTFLGFKLPEK